MTVMLFGTFRGVPCAWCSIRVGDDAVLFEGLVAAGRYRRCRVFVMGETADPSRAIFWTLTVVL